jgi:carboxylesterase type B
VLLTFFGGGFIRGSASFDIPPSGFPVLNVSDQNDYVVVYSNYRTNVFGFLPGSKIASHPDVDLNLGLLDQQAALKWIQKYISKFGGDPKNVTIWGQSAGGGSVVAQTIAIGNQGKKLFTKAMGSSPFWPKTPRYDAPESEAIYQQTLNDVGCASSTDEISCLKSADLQALRDSALRLSTSLQYTTSAFTFGPVIDDKFLTESLSSVICNGTLNADFVLTSYNLHEGENFIPPGFANSTTSSTDGFNSSEASFDSWLRSYLPAFTPSDIAAVKALYPATGTAEEISYNTTYIRAGLLYRDLVLACPSYWLSKTANKGWLMEYTISPAKHASDVQYWNTVGSIQQTDRSTYQAYAGAMASFVRETQMHIKLRTVVRWACQQ